MNKCEFKDDGYIVNYDIKNNPNKRTKGRALVSLKTSKGKLLDSTESKAFSLGKGEEKKGIEIYVPYEGAATKADLYIINGFSKGTRFQRWLLLMWHVIGVSGARKTR